MSGKMKFKADQCEKLATVRDEVEKVSATLRSMFHAEMDEALKAETFWFCERVADGQSVDGDAQLKLMAKLAVDSCNSIRLVVSRVDLFRQRNLIKSCTRRGLLRLVASPYVEC